MKNEGQLIRELRISQGIKLKDFYADIMSKAYSIRFEKGEHEISFYLLKKILEKLSMEMDEFRYLLNGCQLSDEEWFYFEYGKRANFSDIRGLEALKQEYLKRAPQSPFTPIRMAELSARIEQLDYFNRYGIFTNDCISPEYLTVIKNHLDSIQNWTIDHLRFFANTLDFIHYDEKVLYFRMLFPSLDKYLNFNHGRATICVLLINGIHQSMMDLEMFGVDRLLAKLDDFCQEVTDAFYKNYYHFYSGLKLIYDGNENQGEERVMKAIRVFEDIGYNHQADLLKKMREQFLEKVSSTN